MAAAERVINKEKPVRPTEAGRRKRKKELAVVLPGVEVEKRQQAQKREWVSTVGEDVERYLEGGSVAFSQVGLFVMSPFQESTRDLFLSLGASYDLDLVPNESEERTTHLVLEGDIRSGQRRTVVGELTSGKTLDEQGVQMIYFRRQKAG